jgi:hypothetical protein
LTVEGSGVGSGWAKTGVAKIRAVAAARRAGVGSADAGSANTGLEPAAGVRVRFANRVLPVLAGRILAPPI